MKRALRALWAAWTCVGPVRAGSVGQAVPVGDVLWALPWLGVLLGIAWTILFAGTWRVFGESLTGLRLVPALAVLLGDLVLTGRFLMAGVRATEALALGDDDRLDCRRPDITAVGAIAAIALVLGTYVLLLAIPKGIEWWPADWRHHLHWAYPRPIFRPLVLAPAWTCWAMVLAAGMGRAKAGTEDGADAGGRGGNELLDRLAGQAVPSQIFLGFVPAAVISAIYASRDGNLVIGLGVALIVFVCVYATAMAASLRWRGQNGVTILAAGLVGRAAFLLCWLFLGRALHGW